MYSSLINIETVVLLPQHYANETPGLSDALDKFDGNKHQVSVMDVNVEQLLKSEGGFAIFVDVNKNANFPNDLINYFNPLIQKLVSAAKELKISTVNLTIIRKVDDKYSAIKCINLVFLYEFISTQIRLYTYNEYRNSLLKTTANKLDIPNFTLLTTGKELEGLSTAILGTELLLTVLSNSYESKIEDI